MRSVLDQYSKSSSNLERPEDVFDDIDNLVPLDLEYSDEESGQRRRPRFQKRKRRIMSTNRFATFVETKIMPKIRDSRAIPRKVPIRAWFPPILPNQTRLATLFPGELEDPITFSVEVVSIDRLNYYDYEAVSYAWDFSKPSDVKINMAPNHANEDLRGRGTQSLFIRPHAADALHCIRRKDTVLTVWIDSLCMDLANDEEKVAQSQNYAPIFAHARCVDVWIGKDGRIGHVNFNWIKRLVGFGSPQDLDLNASSAIRWEEFLVFMHLDIVCKKIGYLITRIYR